MGLDGVEMVMAFEEGFGVAISDAEAEACVTPRAAVDLIFGKLRASDERVCVSQRAFYLLRKGLIRTLGAARRSVTLDTDVRSLVEAGAERRFWNDLKTAVAARSWPPLVRPRWLVFSLALLFVTGFCALAVATHWTAAAIVSGLIAAAVARWTRRFRSRIPSRYARLRDLVPFAVTSDSIAWTRDQVASNVKRLVIEQLGLKAERYHEDVRFAEYYES
jgi:hypothetical protein